MALGVPSFKSAAFSRACGAGRHFQRPSGGADRQREGHRPLEPVHDGQGFRARRQLRAHLPQVAALSDLTTRSSPSSKRRSSGSSKACATMPELQALFGLDSAAPAHRRSDLFGDSRSTKAEAPARSTTHGGFDDDAPTMSSVAAQRFSARPTPTRSTEYPASASSVRARRRFVAEPGRLAGAGQRRTVAPAMAAAGHARAFAAAPLDASAQRAAVGRKRALCIGINDYPTAPLAGCVSDAEDWAKTLQRSWGSRPPMLA